MTTKVLGERGKFDATTTKAVPQSLGKQGGFDAMTTKDLGKRGKFDATTTKVVLPSLGEQGGFDATMPNANPLSLGK